uniref:Pheromone n=1 Tax=Peronospora matthiolae TaxID=2874970 RepID=A0AAV1VAN1_9STRA
MATFALADAGNVSKSGANCDDKTTGADPTDVLAGFALDNKGVARQVEKPNDGTTGNSRPACLEVGLWCKSIGKTLAADPTNDCKFPSCPPETEPLGEGSM